MVFAKAGDLYLVYLPTSGATTLDLGDATDQFSVSWFDPRNGGPLKRSSVTMVNEGTSVELGNPPDNPSEDWLVVVRR